MLNDPFKYPRHLVQQSVKQTLKQMLKPFKRAFTQAKIFRGRFFDDFFVVVQVKKLSRMNKLAVMNYPQQLKNCCPE